MNHVGQGLFATQYFHSFIVKNAECHPCPSLFCLDASVAFDGVWHPLAVWHVSLQGIN